MLISIGETWLYTEQHGSHARTERHFTLRLLLKATRSGRPFTSVPPIHCSAPQRTVPHTFPREGRLPPRFMFAPLLSHPFLTLLHPFRLFTFFFFLSVLVTMYSLTFGYFPAIEAHKCSFLQNAFSRFVYHMPRYRISVLFFCNF